MAQKTSALWKSLWNDQDTKRVFYFDIAGKIYGEDEIVDHSVKSALFEDFSIGNATTASLHLVLAPKDMSVEIPRGAKIKRFVKLVNGSQESEAIPKGVFYINRRSSDGYQLTLEAFDPMRKADNIWEPAQDLKFPMPMQKAVDIIADMIGVEVDKRNEINPDFTIDYPDSNTSLRDILCWIAAANGGNFIISDAGKLYLVKLSSSAVLLADENRNIITFEDDVSIILQDQPDAGSESGVDHYVGQDITVGVNNGIWLPISRVSLYVSEGQVYTAGDDSGTEITGDCTYANQAIAEYVYNAVKGFVYQMYEADDANIDLSFELGDGVSVDGMVSIIAEVDDDGSGYVSIYAPGETESIEEYPVGVQSSYTQRNTNREIAKTRSEIAKSNEEIRLLVEDEVSGVKSEFKQTMNGIKLSVSETQSDGTTSYAYINLFVDGEQKSGKVNIFGNTEIDGALVANALYAVSAYFNGVTSSKINTKDDISRYLDKNTNGYNYLVAEDNKLKIVQNSPSALTEQAKDTSGNNLYWAKSIAGATIKNGWPYDQSGNRIFMTTNNTGYPVSVYKSAERSLYSVSSVYSYDVPQVIVEINGVPEGSKEFDWVTPGYLRHDSDAMNLFLDVKGFEQIEDGVYGVFIGFQNRYDMPENSSDDNRASKVLLKGDPLALRGGKIDAKGDSFSVKADDNVSFDAGKIVSIKGDTIEFDADYFVFRGRTLDFDVNTINSKVPVNVPTISELDFSGWDTGSFTEKLADGTVQNYSVAFDAEGRPTEISVANNSPIATLSANSKKDDKNAINIKW